MESTIQDRFYQVMFLIHLVLGLISIVPIVVFGVLHGRRAWPRPNRQAVRAGLALFSTAMALLISGIVLTRFGSFELRDPQVREGIYWIHVISPLAMIWLFVLHRLAGSGIRWRVGLFWTAMALAFSISTILPKSPFFTTNGLQDTSSSAPLTSSEQPFFPSLTRIENADTIPAQDLMKDEYCKVCHADVHEQWRYSAHKLSSFNNPAYLFSVRETRRFFRETTGNDQATRFCAGCHDPVPIFSGALDDPNFDDTKHPTANAGITCISCHSITRINSPRGNGDYTIEAPQHYPFTDSQNPVLQWINHQLIKAKPAFHKTTFLKPLHKSPDFCGVCHKVHIPAEVNGYKWLRGQNHYDAYHLSGVSGHGATSFYYPDKAVHRCSVCHMPPTPSDDFGAMFLDDPEQLKVHNHQFPAANTALPHLLDLPKQVLQAHQTFLKNALRVDIFGIKEDGQITGKLLAPLRPQIPTLEAGKRYLLEVVIRNLRIGHLFTQGTADSNQIWLKVMANSGSTPIGQSGAMDKQGNVDPWSHFVNAYVLDRHGNRIDRRNGQDIFTPLYNHQIPPGTTDVVHFAFEIPKGIDEPITIAVKLQYRKFDTTYLQYIQGDEFVSNNLPITTIAEDRITFPIHTSPGKPAATANVTDTDISIPTWERWNDYGIGLLRKGKKGSSKGELRQAEQAFTEVEKLGKADGPLNLARVYLKEGRLANAGAALRRAALHHQPASPWVVEWLTGLVNKQNGYLDEAIDNFTRVIHTDFPLARQREFDFSQDYRVRNELGQTLFERAKQERGPTRSKNRQSLLHRAKEQFLHTLRLDPENVTAHYNLALIYAQLGQRDSATNHRKLHMKYKPDDNARERVVAIHRRNNPAANHAAESVVIYELK